jgi:hypothetical protein
MESLRYKILNVNVIIYFISGSVKSGMKPRNCCQQSGRTSTGIDFVIAVSWLLIEIYTKFYN